MTRMAQVEKQPPLVTRRALAGLAALVALLGAALVIWLAIWKLPEVLIDNGAYRLPNGKLDTAAAQDAYNAVRVPIGVASAALLAAGAAAAGVYMNARTVAVARDGLLQAQSVEAERRSQWQQEQLHTRFQDAAKQLGDPAAPVRLAGAYAMAHLADDWEAQRQACIDVLCAYCRMPLDVQDVAERQVRSVIVTEIFCRLRPDAQVFWGRCHINLTGAFIEGLRMPGPLSVKSSLILDEAVFSDFTYLDQLDLHGSISMDHAKFSASFRLLARLTGDSWIGMAGAEAGPGTRVHLGIWQSDAQISRPGFVHINMNNFRANSARVLVSLWGWYSYNFLFASGVSVVRGSFAVCSRDGVADAGAIRLPALEVQRGGRFLANASASASMSCDTAPEIVSDDSDEVDDWDPRDAIFV